MMNRCIDENTPPVGTNSSIRTYPQSGLLTASAAYIAAPQQPPPPPQPLPQPPHIHHNNNQYFEAAHFSAMPALIPHENVVQLAPPHAMHATLMPIPRQNKTPAPAATIPTANNAAMAGMPKDRLKVEDALTYLDQVKLKFGTEPQVYNDFLDIMKEFKSQSIDTPGVITRVSNLFKGHPELIVGFNTFLPPGYKIEVHHNDKGYTFQVQMSQGNPANGVTSMQTIHHSTVSMSGQTMYATNSVKPPLPPPSSVNNNYGRMPVGGVGPVAASISPPHIQAPNQPQHQAVSQALIHVESSNANQPVPQSQNQPVEFNHAINYVNKIKLRFQDQPDKYKRFLEILHTYQKEQRIMKETQRESNYGSNKILTEQEVYAQVAKLFEKQEDLLDEFGQFLPDATSHQSLYHVKNHEQQPGGSGGGGGRNKAGGQVLGGKSNYGGGIGIGGSNSGSGGSSGNTPNSVANINGSSSSAFTKYAASTYGKRCPLTAGVGGISGSGVKRVRLSKEREAAAAAVAAAATATASASTAGNERVGEPNASSHATLMDYSFFDHLRRRLRNHNSYSDFLRCIHLFNEDVLNKSEIILATTPFLSGVPDLFKLFKEFVGYSEAMAQQYAESSRLEGITYLEMRPVTHRSVTRVEYGIPDVDYSSCRRLGASYCQVPKNLELLTCTGRLKDPKAGEVLNDEWVSFPMWSEDSTFVSSKKSAYEEYLYRAEDEHFELDLIIETNTATIMSLEKLQKRVNRMAAAEAYKFQLDESLGGCPNTTQRAIKRVYGTERGADLVAGLRANPAVTIPVLLRRLHLKDEEWRLSMTGLEKMWREQLVKYHSKSLDVQGAAFKQNDMKFQRSKSLMNEMEVLFTERLGKEGGETGPHLTLSYEDKDVMEDAASLLIHHVKRQTTIHKEDKQRIKAMVRHFVPDLFHHVRQEFSDDEAEDAGDDSDGKDGDSADEEGGAVIVKVEKAKRKSALKPDDGDEDLSMVVDSGEDLKIPSHAICADTDECYYLFYGDSRWYLFLRLHHLLCQRLGKMKACQATQGKDTIKVNQYALMTSSKQGMAGDGNNSYTGLLELVKSVLDGNLESTAYEDNLRELFGIHAYMAFTLDKLVSHTVRQLQYIITDDKSQDCHELFLKESEKTTGGTGGSCVSAHQRAWAEAAYRRKFETLSTEWSFKFVFYKNEGKISVECLSMDGGEDSEDAKKKEEDEIEREQRKMYEEDVRDIQKLLEMRPSLAVNTSNAMEIDEGKVVGKRKDSDEEDSDSEEDIKDDLKMKSDEDMEQVMGSVKDASPSKVRNQKKVEEDEEAMEDDGSRSD